MCMCVVYALYSLVLRWRHKSVYIEHLCAITFTFILDCKVFWQGLVLFSFLVQHLVQCLALSKQCKQNSLAAENPGKICFLPSRRERDVRAGAELEADLWIRKSEIQLQAPDIQGQTMGRSVVDLLSLMLSYHRYNSQEFHQALTELKQDYRWGSGMLQISWCMCLADKHTTFEAAVTHEQSLRSLHLTIV